MTSRRMFWILALVSSTLVTAPAQNPPPFHPADLRIDVNGVFLPGSDPGDNASTMINVSMGIHVHGIPSRYFLQVQKAAVELKTQGGDTLPVQEPVERRNWRHPPNYAVQGALSGSRLFAAEQRPFSIAPIFAMRNDLLQNYRADWLRFSATVDFQIMECREAARLPLRQGAENGGSKIEFVKRLVDAVEVKLAGTPKDGEVCVLENASRRESFLGKPVWTFQNNALVVHKWRFVDADSPSGKPPARDWLANAEVVVLREHQVGAFSRSFERDPLQLNFDIPSQSGKISDFNAEALAKIQLPPNATKAQMLEFAKAIVAQSRAQKTLGYEDPQTAMLMSLGPENLDVLIEAAPVPRTHKDLHIWKAMRELVQASPGQAQRDMIFTRLWDKPDLAELIKVPEWRTAAQPILLRGLEEGRNDLPADWLELILDFRDPKTYPAITAYFARNPTEPGLYETVRQLPGINLKALMPGAWATAKRGTVRQQSVAIHPACEWGVADALATAALWLAPDSSDYQKRVGRFVFKRFTPASGTDGELVAWHEANKNTLVFDEDTKTFRPAKSPSKS